MVVCLGDVFLALKSVDHHRTESIERSLFFASLIHLANIVIDDHHEDSVLPGEALTAVCYELKKRSAKHLVGHLREIFKRNSSSATTEGSIKLREEPHIVSKK